MQALDKFDIVYSWGVTSYREYSIGPEELCTARK